QCTPLSSQAIAGNDTAFYDYTLSTTLAANTPDVGRGLWTVESGDGGMFSYDTLPGATFTGQPCTDYTLAWSISNICDTTTDHMDVTFFTTPSVADAGHDTFIVDPVASVNLYANTPVVGSGLWTIISGEGGIIADTTNPASLFSGIFDETYMLEWAISNSCDTTFDRVNVTFLWRCGFPITDNRDSLTYGTVEIGVLCWMAENLNHATGNSWCYGNNPANCDTYGRLYNWEMALVVCPSGWHLPTDDEWKILEGIVDSQYPVGAHEWDPTNWRGFDAGKNLKSTSGWYNNGNGTGHFGFGALPGGIHGSSGSFYDLGSSGYWWTSNGSSGTNAWGRYLYYDDDRSNRGYGNRKMNGFSVRCLKDNSL
ncbi:MAG: hypothetical protein GY746_15930, partial [Gammaproteobacteria bacterium]|nr:hypothetical protein [Gammaproteobacteria bacterium]